MVGTQTLFLSLQLLIKKLSKLEIKKRVLKKNKILKSYIRKRAYGISLFLVDTNLPGFKKGRLLKKIGMASSDTAELFFD